ncbi:trypsin-like peptidase domain-containing protein [Streptomyces winkii]|uniref:trypsin-like peptidase domain-containing protein n=1 Tax=Streptomyces winkii TaxID=3051178 RepID=UPI0028D87D42|nr:trypsin-like peptidase domain-containing protein [Streptomyces sp. DSM 40971]
MGAMLAEQTLVRICDLAGRPRGTGFVADGTGTVITSHEAVDGLARVVVHAPGGRSHLAESDAVTSLPEWDLALVRTEGLGVAPLLIGTERAAEGATPVRLFMGAGEGDSRGDGAEAGWAEGELAGTAADVTYTSTDRFHAVEGALRLTLPEASPWLLPLASRGGTPREAPREVPPADRLRLDRQASGSPVLDGESGAVLAVLGTALHAPGAGRGTGFAVPLRTAGLWDAEGPLGAVLARNNATVPGFGPDLNLAGALRLTAATVHPAVQRAASLSACLPAAGSGGRCVDRPEVAGALDEFCVSGASVAALVGRPGTGRTTQLAALASRRAAGAEPAPTVWLRGAQLREGDSGVREALGRALDSGPLGVPPRGSLPAKRGGEARGRHRTARAADGAAASRADVVARLAREARRPLLVVLDAPEEMPVPLSRDLRRWTACTASWLRASGARMVLACGPEQWEELGELFPSELLYGERVRAGSSELGSCGLPPCVPLGDLPAEQAADARESYGLGAGDLAEADAGHPLAMRMLAEIRTAQGGSAEYAGRGAGSRPAPLTRDEIFSAYLDLVALRIARMLGGPMARAGDVRRLAAHAAGALHEAARRCLGPGRGALSRAGFEEVFPRAGGWADAVLRDGVLEAADRHRGDPFSEGRDPVDHDSGEHDPGEQYRFADEEFGDWLQGRHLDVDAALAALVHGGHPGGPAASAARMPRHRIGPVVHALVTCARLAGAEALERRLRPLADAVVAGGKDERVWWARRLLRETLLRVDDARPYYGLLRGLAEHFAAQRPGCAGEFGPPFWRRLALPTAQRTGLLRLLLPADAPHGAAGNRGEERYLDVVGELLTAEPETVQPLLCGWFTDRRPLSGPEKDPASELFAGTGPGGSGDVPRPTVASVAQALLYAHRRRIPDMTLDLLTDACHPRADELLGELALEEPSVMCRAVERWAHDERTLRRIAAAEYGPRMVRYAARDAGRRDRGSPAADRRASDRRVSDRRASDVRHLESAAHALLAGSGGSSVYGPAALAMLLRLHRQPPAAAAWGAGAESSPERDRHLADALRLLGATGSAQLAAVLVEELGGRPAPALAAFRAALCEQSGDGARRLAETLADVRDDSLAVPTAEVVRDYAATYPETAGDALAAFVRRRLAHRPEGCPGLQLLTDAVLSTPHTPLRASLARALREAGEPMSPAHPRRGQGEELLDVLLLGERDPAVLEAALATVARSRPDGAGEAREKHETGRLVEAGAAVPEPSEPRAARPAGPDPARGRGERVRPAGPARTRVPCGGH